VSANYSRKLTEQMIAIIDHLVYCALYPTFWQMQGSYNYILYFPTMRVLQGSIGRKGASIVRLIFIQVNMILVVYIHFS
jgi:hypothetical protein